MRIKLTSISGVVYQGEVSSLTLPTTSGEITVLPHHRALISVVKEGTIRLLEPSGKELFFPIRAGFIEVDRFSNVNVLLN